MNHFLRACAAALYSLGGLGLLLLGFFDSSFLFFPLGNDLLMIALTAAHHERMLYYVAMATLGSVAGVDVTRWLSARGGKKGIEMSGKSRRAAYVERKIRERGGIAIAVAALMPPPFPFTLFVITAAALQYPRKKMLPVIAVSRGVRFAIDGCLALIFGRRIIRMAQSPAVEAFVLAVVAISIVGSVISIWSWIRKSRSPAQ